MKWIGKARIQESGTESLRPAVRARQALPPYHWAQACLGYFLGCLTNLNNFKQILVIFLTKELTRTQIYIFQIKEIFVGNSKPRANTSVVSDSMIPMKFLKSMIYMVILRRLRLLISNEFVKA